MLSTALGLIVRILKKKGVKERIAKVPPFLFLYPFFRIAPKNTTCFARGKASSSVPLTPSPLSPTRARFP